MKQLQEVGQVTSPYLPRPADIVEVEQFTETEKLFRLVLKDGTSLGHGPGQFVEVSLFGYAEAVQMSLQGRGFPTQFVQMIPYVLTMVALVGVIGRARPPAALGKPY